LEGSGKPRWLGFKWYTPASGLCLKCQYIRWKRMYY